MGSVVFRLCILIQAHFSSFLRLGAPVDSCSYCYYDNITLIFLQRIFQKFYFACINVLSRGIILLSLEPPPLIKPMIKIILNPPLKESPGLSRCATAHAYGADPGIFCEKVFC